jgi:signal transduction histidine kinase
MKYVFEKTDVRKIVEDLASDMKVASDAHHLMFTSAIDPLGEYVMNVDGVKLKQVFLNLVDNSIKYTKEGFVHVELSKRSHNKEVVFSVSDSGVGISKEAKTKLFTKFGRGESGALNSGGSGLGLYLALEIVKAHKGVITIDSEGVGKGSTFFVSIPFGE